MPRKRKTELIAGKHFKWLLGTRHGVYFADGRSNQINVGRHSLATRDRDTAIQNLHRLDLTKAVEFGLENRRALETQGSAGLGLEDGWQLYRSHVQRPRVVGGAKPVTSKRYKAVFDKFIRFVTKKGITCWNQITRRTLESYAGHLDAEGYAPRSQYLELTCVKQALKFFVKEGNLPSSHLFELSLAKPEGTDVYCWRLEEVKEIVAHCRQREDLLFLANAITGLACTGLRISELDGLRWSDIDLDNNLIRLIDESGRARRAGTDSIRETKSGRSRSFPIHEDLKRILDGLPRSRDGRVFHGPRGAAIKADTVRRILVRDVITPLAGRFPKAPGEVGFEDGRLHGFRHFFCSTCANTNVPQRVVMHWLGHSDSGMVEHYYHLHDDEAQRQMKRLDFLGESGGADTSGAVS